jgi:hypothetical protein
VLPQFYRSDSPQQSLGNAIQNKCTFSYQMSGTSALGRGASITFKPAVVCAAPSKETDHAKFLRSLNEWKRDRHATSSTIDIVMNPAYQRIISLGTVAIPWIFAELQREPDHWFWALRVLTEKDPVPPLSRGNMEEMTDAWLKWGRENAYLV